VTIEPPLPEYTTPDRMSRSSTNSFPTGNLDTDTTFYRYYFPLAVDGREVRSFYVVKDASTGDFWFSSMGLTPSPLIRDAVKKVETLSEVQAGSFEVRLLDYSRINPALWLKSTAGGADLVYVIDPFRSPTNQPQTVGSIMNDHTGGAGQLYKVADFIAKIRGSVSVVPLVTVSPIAPVPAAPAASSTSAPVPPATTMSATVVSTGTPTPGAMTVTGTLEFKVGSAGGSLPLTINVGQPAVIALGSDGISIHINSRIGPAGNILCQSSFQLADATGHVREGFTSGWSSPSPTTPLMLHLRDISYSFTPAPGSILPAAAPAPAPAPMPVALTVAERNAAVTENKRKATSGEDTTSTRLQGLATDLDGALAGLKQLPPETTKFFAKTTADILQAKVEVAGGLDYLKAHPEFNSLAARVRAALNPNLAGPLWTPSGAVTVRDVNGGANLAVAVKSLRDGFNDLGNPREGRPLLGEIGGIRDRILRAVVVANLDLVANNREYLASSRGTTPTSSAPSSTTLTLAALAKGSADPTHTGSIAGHLVTADTSPAVDVLLAITVVDSLNAPAQGRGVVPANLPVTITDDNGNFAIKNLPPGFYALVAGSTRVVVEVKEGAETKLPEPLKYTLQIAVGGGAGG